MSFSPGSVVAEASLIDPDISPIPSLIFTGVQNVRNWDTISELWNTFGKRRWSPYVLAKFSKVQFTHPWEVSGESAQLRKIWQRKCAKSSIPQPRINRFCSNFVQSLNTWDPKRCKSSRSKGQSLQRLRSQHDVTGAKLSRELLDLAKIS